MKKLTQDLHIHSIFSSMDSAVVPQQNFDTIAFAKHADIVGISDHFEHFMPHRFNDYKEALDVYGFLVGTEVNGHESVDIATKYDFDYYIYHCWGEISDDYTAVQRLIRTNKPVIIAHPYATETDLNKIPEECYVEINNRYIWRYNWKKELAPFKNKFRWIISSDAHQPNWLNQNIARKVAEYLGIEETILFEKKEPILAEF